MTYEDCAGTAEGSSNQFGTVSHKKLNCKLGETRAHFAEMSFSATVDLNDWSSPIAAPASVEGGCVVKYKRGWSWRV